MSVLSTNVRSRKLLVVDDDVDAADTLRILFELNGDRAVAAHSGATALELARAVHPDIILCDLGMPRMDGFAFARAIRSDPSLRDVRLVAMTGRGLDSDADRSKAEGFDLHLVKPIPWPEVCRAIQSLGSG